MKPKDVEKILSKTLLKAGKVLELVADTPEIRTVFLESQEMLRQFFQSQAYDVLRNAKIIGREIPFLIPIEPTSKTFHASAIRGVMDVVYEIDGRTVIGDYKTSRLMLGHQTDVPEKYRIQAHFYRIALKSVLKIDADFVIFSLREGTTLKIENA